MSQKGLTCEEYESIQLYIAVIYRMIQQAGGELTMDIAGVPKGACILAKLENNVVTLRSAQGGNA